MLVWFAAPLFFIPLGSTSISLRSVSLAMNETDLVVPIHYALSFGGISTAIMIMRDPSAAPMDAEVELQFEGGLYQYANE